MPSAEIISYTAHTGRLGELGSEKFIVLSHKTHAPDGGTTEATSEIYFADRFGAASFGYSCIGTETNVTGYLPEAEYVHWIDLLRYEDPIFLHWSQAEVAGEADSDGILHLSTGPEPPGEGPIDLTP